MRRKIFLDTVFVVALINERDQHHQQANEVTKKYEGYPLLTTNAVLLEIGNSLSRNHKQNAIAVIEGFLTSINVEVVHLTPQIFEKALAMYKTYSDKSWGLVDCSSFVVMREAGVTQVLTVDRHFEQAGFQILMSI